MDARPATVTFLGFSGVTFFVSGSRSSRNSYTSVNACREVVTSVCALFGKLTFSAPAICRDASPSPQTARVGTPPGSAVAVRPSKLT